jgi:hypothetical protein
MNMAKNLEVVGYAMGVLLPDLLRNLDKVNDVAEMRDLFSAFLDRHIKATAVDPLHSDHAAFFVAMRKGVEAWSHHAKDEG